MVHPAENKTSLFKKRQNLHFSNVWRLTLKGVLRAEAVADGFTLVVTVAVVVVVVAVAAAASAAVFVVLVVVVVVVIGLK